MFSLNFKQDPHTLLSFGEINLNHTKKAQMPKKDQKNKNNRKKRK